VTPSDEGCPDHQAPAQASARVCQAAVSDAGPDQHSAPARARARAMTTLPRNRYD